MRHRRKPWSCAFKASKGTYGILFLRPLIHFNANSHHYYYRIRKVLRNHTRCCEQRSIFILLLTMGAVETRPSRKMPIRILVFFRNALHYLLLLTMDCRGRERDKAGADMRVVSLKPHLVLFATLFSFLLVLIMECRGREREYTKKGRAKMICTQNPGHINN